MSGLDYRSRVRNAIRQGADACEGNLLVSYDVSRDGGAIGDYLLGRTAIIPTEAIIHEVSYRIITPFEEDATGATVALNMDDPAGVAADVELLAATATVGATQDAVMLRPDAYLPETRNVKLSVATANFTAGVLLVDICYKIMGSSNAAL